MQNVLQSERDVDHWQATAQARTACITNETTGKLLKILQSIDLPLRVAFRQIDRLAMRDSDRDTEQFLDWISIVDCEARYEEVRTSRMKGTGLWLSQDEGYRQWQSSNSSCMLWLSGMSKYRAFDRCKLTDSMPVGSGKSVVTSMIVEQTRARGSATKDVPMAFFFCDRTSRQEQLKNCSIIYRLILRQLLETSRIKPPDYLHSIYRRHKGGYLLSEETCLTAIVEVIQTCPDTVTLVLDALDECEVELRTSLLAALQHLISNSKRNSEGVLKVFITSRRERDIVDTLEAQTQESVFAVSMQNEQDISDFIKQQIERDFKLKRFPIWFIGSKDKLIEQLIAKSQGM